MVTLRTSTARRVGIAATLLIALMVSVAYGLGGYWKPAGDSPYTVKLTDQAKNTVLGKCKKTVRWQWEDQGGITVTEWDDEATFVFKDKDEKEHKIPNDQIRRRILDLQPGFTGELRGNIKEQLLVEGNAAYIRVKECAAKPLEDATPKGIETKFTFGQTIKLIKRKDGRPTMWLVSNEKDQAWIPEYLLAPNKREIDFLQKNERIPATMAFVYKEGEIKVWGRVRFGPFIVDSQGLAASADGSSQVALKDNAVLFDESAVKHAWKNPMVFSKGNTTYKVESACLYYCVGVDDAGKGSFDCIDLTSLTFCRQ